MVDEESEADFNPGTALGTSSSYKYYAQNNTKNNAAGSESQDEDDDIEIPLFHDCDREILGNNVKALSNRCTIFTL